MMRFVLCCQKWSKNRRRLLLMMMFTLGGWICLVPPRMAHAEEDVGIWAAIFAQGEVFGVKNFLYFQDIQVRMSKAGQQFSQALVRPAFGYQLPFGFSVWLGYLWASNKLTSTDVIQREHRIWQQMIWTRKFKIGFDLFSRTRFEQRWAEGSPDVSVRLRQMFKVTWFPHPKSPIGFTIWDEFFLHFNAVSWSTLAGFNQNRFFAGLTVVLSKTLKWELGYMHQWVDREPADKIVHVLGIKTFITF